MEAIFSAFIAAFVGVFIGSWVSDQTTLRQCATQQEAKLMGSTKIKCEVQRSQP